MTRAELRERWDERSRLVRGMSASGMTGADIAARLGLSKSTVSGLLTGDRSAVAARTRARRDRMRAGEPHRRPGPAPKWPLERCTAAIAAYYARTGERPTMKELRSNPDLPTDTILAKFPGKARGILDGICGPAVRNGYTEREAS